MHLAAVHGSRCRTVEVSLRHSHSSAHCTPPPPAFERLALPPPWRFGASVNFRDPPNAAASSL